MFTKKNLQTPNEAEFYYCLVQAFPGYSIAYQVAYSTFIEAYEYEDRSQFRTYYADFVVCDKITFEPLLVIELDDRSHQREYRIERDERKNDVLYNAQIPICRFTAKGDGKYSAKKIRTIIEPLLIEQTETPEYKMFKKKNLQNHNEAIFYHCLLRAFPEYSIAYQVAYSAFVEADEYKDRSQFRNYYANFVICDETTFKPLFVIELNDLSHQKKSRDERKDYVLCDAQIQRCRFIPRNDGQYSSKKVRTIIEHLLIGQTKTLEYDQPIAQKIPVPPQVPINTGSVDYVNIKQLPPIPAKKSMLKRIGKFIGTVLKYILWFIGAVLYNVMEELFGDKRDRKRRKSR